MRQNKNEDLADYEEWLVDELMKYSSQDTAHFTEHCFEQTYLLGQKASVLATKFFYSSLFNKPAQARWAIDRVLELPHEYKGECLLDVGHNLAILYKHMIEEDPDLDKLMKHTYQNWLRNL